MRIAVVQVIASEENSEGGEGDLALTLSWCLV